MEDPLNDVSRETIEKLKEFAELVRKWTKSINLIAPNTVPAIWNRHIIDSAQVFNAAPGNWEDWLDIGSGGGFPGLVIAILDSERRPVHLIESDARKATFLNTARRALDLNATVHNARIEDVSPLGTHVVSARALAPLPRLIDLAHPHLSVGGSCLFQKGRQFAEELDQAKNSWHFDHDAIESITSPDARILRLSRIIRREPEPNH